MSGAPSQLLRRPKAPRLRTSALAFAFVVAGAFAGCKKTELPPPVEAEGTRTPPPDLPFDERDREERAEPWSGTGGEAGAAGEGQPSGARREGALARPVTDVDGAKEALAGMWPDLEVSCWSFEGCFQRGDLDADGQPDAMVMVREACEAAPCPVGVVIFSSRGEHLRLGAGLDPALAWIEWELGDDDAPQWTPSGTTAKSGADWMDTQALEVSPATGPTACATSMARSGDVLVISGTDAAGALFWYEGDWALTDCGY